MSLPSNSAQTWGRWFYDPTLNTLEIPAYPQSNYQIDLDECTTVGKVLDWMLHLGEKTWCTPADLGNLWKAFRDLLGGYPTFVHPTINVPLVRRKVVSR